MSNQSIMVPPNNAPWPGLHSPQSQSHQPSSPYPPPPHYYHPGHPPPPHSPHQQPYYPYHPYPAGPYPPYIPQHSTSHPSYHSYNPSNEPQEKSSSNSKPSASSTSAKEPVSSANSSKPSPSSSVKSTKPSTTSSPKTSNSKSESSDNKSSSSSKLAPTPKTFRFEGSISSETYKTTKSFDLAGVNILNRKPLDTRTALDKLQRRRETHNRVERKRRDCINQLIDDLTKLLPPKHLEEVTSKCHRVNVLRGAVAHIKFLTETNSTLNSSLSAAKTQGFSDIDLDAVQSSKETGNGEVDIDMTMDVDASESGKQDNDDEGLDEDDDDINDDVNDGDDSEDQSALAGSTSSRSQSPSASPSLVPSKIMSRPPVIITTNSPGPSPEKDQSQPKTNLVPPPISIIDAPSEPQSSEHRRQRSNSSSSFSSSPLFPPSDYTTPGLKASAFPPSPVSPSPSSRSNPFSHKGEGSEEHQAKKDQQQLSPFSQHRSTSVSPALPPISTFGDIQQSAERMVSNDRRSSEHQMSVQSSPGDATTNGNAKYGSARSATSLPPLKIPTQQHLSPYANHDSNQSSQRNNSLAPSPQFSSASPRHQRGGEEQMPVSPFMLSPHSRSPSIGPVSGGPHYSHWGHEGAEAPPPPPPHYMPNSLSPHTYPHGYPYPYPYHPSYGYPHPHGPPPHHHHHHQHGPTPTHSTQKSSSQARSPQPEPIFIQEEPWIVQRKRSTSATANKNQSSGAKPSNKKAQEKDDEEPPMSPPSSVTSSISNNAKKRPSSTDDSIVKSVPDSPKRAKQIVDNDQSNKNTKSQVDSDVIVVVEEVSNNAKDPSSRDIEMSPDNAKRVEDDADAAQTLTTLGQNTIS